MCGLRVQATAEQGKGILGEVTLELGWNDRK